MHGYRTGSQGESVIGEEGRYTPPAVLGRIFAGQGQRLEKLLSDLGVACDIRIYESAGHSFMSRHTGLLAGLGAIGPMKAGYDPEAAEDSWRRIASFFAEHLGEQRST